MPMSQEATEGLRAAVEFNPTAAEYFMHILRDLPIGVRYKEQDRYGPLAMMIFGSSTIKITHEIEIPVKNSKTFPQEKLRLCEIFNEEWLQRRFTKQELADIIEQMLAKIKPTPLLEETNASSTLIMTAEGTFLVEEVQGRKVKRKIDPEQM